MLRGDQSRVIVSSGEIAPVRQAGRGGHRGPALLRAPAASTTVSIARALLTDLLAGHTVQGGSTITQQFIKNAYLPQDQRTADTMSRKLREAVLAYQLEKRWSKDQILTDYLNTIYFGESAYGIEMAARTFFGTSARRLTLPQAALLAGIVQDPSALRPVRRTRPPPGPAAAKCCDAMSAQGMISAADAAAAARAPLPRRPHGLPRSHLAPYFVEYVIQQLVNQFGAATAFGGGLRVYTTLDPARAARRQPGRHVDPRTARRPDRRRSSPSTRTQTRSRRWSAAADFAGQQFDVAVDGRRQPGSAFKPFALAAAIRQGMSPTSVFISEPKAIDLGGGEIWRVSTYSGSYAGKITPGRRHGRVRQHRLRRPVDDGRPREHRRDGRRHGDHEPGRRQPVDRARRPRRPA